MVTTIDNDLELLSPDELIAEIIKLRTGIRNHRDSTKHKLCWHHPQLWNLLPEKTEPEIEVPEWAQFMRGCIYYRQSLDEQKPNSKRIQKEFDE